MGFCVARIFSVVGVLAFAAVSSTATAQLPDPLTLEYALSLADAPHPLLDRADARLAAARAEQLQVDAVDNVKVDLELAARLIEPSPAVNEAEPSNNDSWGKLRIHKRLYDFGRTDYLTAAAEAELRGREQALLSTRQQRRLEVMTRYFDVLLADLEQARDMETMAIAFVRVDRARSRHELGQVSDIELLELESRYQALLRRQRTSQAKQRASRSRLALSLNFPGELPANLEFPPLPELDREAGEVETLVEAALTDNPELRALRQSVEAARKRTDAATAGNGAVLRGEIEGAAYNRYLGSSNPFTAALVLDVPLSSGGALDAEAARNRALRRQKQAELASRELEVRQAVLDQWLELQTLDARRKELAAMGEFRELDFDRSRTLYEMEVAADLGDSMAKISEVRLLQAENDFNTALSWARLDALTGRLIDGTDPSRQGALGLTGSEAK
jgi:outer membrane protein TolC